MNKQETEGRFTCSQLIADLEALMEEYGDMIVFMNCEDGEFELEAIKPSFIDGYINALLI